MEQLVTTYVFSTSAKTITLSDFNVSRGIGTYCTGTVQDVALYTYALTMSQIKNHYSAAKGTLYRALAP